FIDGFTIVGSDNIVGSGISGLPSTDTSGLAISSPVSTDPTSSTKQGDQLTDASKALNTKPVALPSLITVEVLALGDAPVTPSATNTSSSPTTTTPVAPAASRVPDVNQKTRQKDNQI
ncbi:MAG: hypothetical protein WC696_07330, partial [Candidatus Methylopumilus sp.]